MPQMIGMKEQMKTKNTESNKTATETSARVTVKAPHVCMALDLLQSINSSRLF